MAQNSTISFSFELKDGQNGLKTLTLNVKDLHKFLDATVSEAKKLNDSFINFAAIATGIDSVNNTFNTVKNTLTDLSNAYSAQVEAETKLAVNMRNTMGAREEDIQSIKDLCAAQQELGIIGDEVQLAGAQELATYLEEKRNLEQLIPVMNDMLAQQYGLNATQENAAQIASMLGKVMEGQTGALSRYGYKFDEAQEQILKYGTEAQRVAVLSEVITASVGGMNAELAKTDVGKQKQLENTLGDIKERLGGLAQSAMPFLTIASNAVVALTSISKLATGIGVVTKALLGWEAGQKALSAVKLLGTGIIQKATQATNIFSTAALGSAASTTALRIALQGLMMATGIGIAIAAVTAAVSYFAKTTDDATDSTDKFLTAEERAQRSAERLAELHKQEESTLNNTRAALEINMAKLKDFNGTKEQEQKLVDDMNNTYGETMGYFSSVADWYNALVSNSEAYCKQMVIEARTRALANQIAEKKQEKHDVMFNSDGSKRLYSLKNERTNTSEDTAHIGMSGGFSANYTRQEKPNSSPWHKATEEVKTLNSEIESLEKQLSDEIKEASSIDFNVKGSTTRPKAGNTTTGSTKTDPVWTEDPKTLKQYNDNIALLDKQLQDATKESAVAINQKKEAFQKEADAIREAGKEVKNNSAQWRENAESIAEVEENIRYLKEELSETKDSSRRIELNQQIEGLNSRVNDMKNEGLDKNNSDPIVNPDAFKLKDIESNISALNSQLQDASEETAASLNKEIEMWQKKADAIRNAGKETMNTSEMMQKGYQSLKGIGSGVESITGALEGNGNAWQTVTGIVDGFIQIAEGIKSIIGIIDMLTVSTEVQTAATVSGVVATEADVVATEADTEASLMNIAAKSGESIANATASGAKLPFPANLVAIAAGVAAVVSALAMIGGFATGGIVGGGSMTGDKLLARVNSGEMILNRAQQANLFKMINAPSAIRGVSVMQPQPIAVALDVSTLHNLSKDDPVGGSVKFKIDGRTLVGILKKENNLINRS